MTGTDWAYVPSDPPPRTLLDDLVEAEDNRARTDLLEQLGRFARACDEESLFAATADNVTLVVDDGLVLARMLAPGITPLDRQASFARIAWHLSWGMLQAGVVGPDDPDRSVDEHAVMMSGRLGIPVDLQDVERFRAHEAAAHAAVGGFDPSLLASELRAMGACTARHAAATELLEHHAMSRALVAAYDALGEARRDRDAAEVDAVELAANRALARNLGEVLERDEWIRARLRTIKATKPARALIEARKRMLGRS
jgi:hypothetical protein